MPNADGMESKGRILVRREFHQQKDDNRSVLLDSYRCQYLIYVSFLLITSFRSCACDTCRVSGQLEITVFRTVRLRI